MGAALTRDARIVRCALGCALAAILLASCASSPATPTPLRARLVTWNIHHGEGLDGKVDVDRLAAELRALAPDIVCLQEVDVGVARSGRLDIPTELAARLHMHAAFGKNIDYQGGDYGNAVLSRWPLAWHDNRHYRMLRPGEQRGLLTCGLRTERGVMAIGCTHLDYRPDPEERLAHALEVLDTVRERQLLLVAGDFNDRPGSPLHQRLCGPMSDCWAQVRGRAGESEGGASFPSQAPDRRIDWILACSASVTPTSCRVVATLASDHRPVVIDFDVPNAAALPPDRP